MTYTTQELIDILDRELRANWKGERVVLSSAERLDNPVVAKALNLQKISKVFAYQDFRQQIHAYQREHGISGVIWRTTTFKGKTLRFPELHNQLVVVPGDKEILMAAKAAVVAFWWEAVESMSFWLAGDRHKKITPDYVLYLVRQAEWADLDAAQTELYLGLCWGNPQECQYRWAKPKSGCNRIIAASDRPSSIKV
ncbi:MAG: hypothetical protein ACFB4I_15860 [Cyanophyceae cyanobacterium]